MHNKSLSLALLSGGFLLSGGLCMQERNNDDWAVTLLVIGMIIALMCLMAVYSKER